MPHAALLGTVDEEQAAERPEGLAADRILALLLDDDDALAGVGEFGRGDETGQARADDDGVGVQRKSSHSDADDRLVPEPVTRHSAPAPSRARRRRILLWPQPGRGIIILLPLPCRHGRA